MKVLLVNGSPHKTGNTYAALSVVGTVLQKDDIEIEIFHIGNKMVRGCINCKKCQSTQRCIFTDDCCNDLITAFLRADGIIIGSPVYFAGPNGALCALLDRVFYAASEHGQLFKGKPAAALATCYRAGATATIDRLNKYFAFSQMPIVSSDYWNMTVEKGSRFEDDVEGLHILQTLGKNMSATLKKLHAENAP
jgi:multimeric flavodoxin WrbA